MNITNVIDAVHQKIADCVLEKGTGHEPDIVIYMNREYWAR